MKSPLPVIEGVAPSYIRLPAGGGRKTVLDFLTGRFANVEKSVWLSRMARGAVVDEKGNVLDSTSLYRAGACVFYYRELQAEAPVPFAESILYRDAHILAADKPHFLPVVPSGRFLRETLLARLRRKKENLESLAPLHRIDRETAGVVMFSVNPATRGVYASLFNDRKVEKIYEAIGANNPNLEFPVTRRSRMVAGEPFFRMKEVAGEPNSETRVSLVNQLNENANLYRLNALTGKKHQIRLHLAALGIPILNDRFYPENSGLLEDDFSAPLKLLAKSVAFRDPLNGEERFFESEKRLSI